MKKQLKSNQRDEESRSKSIVGRGIVDKRKVRKVSVKKRKDVCTKG